jgi:hypothetical protein
MARWFGVGLLAIGMITWFARDEAASLAGRAIARALTLSYGAGVLLAVLGNTRRPLQCNGMDSGRVQPGAERRIRVSRDLAYFFRKRLINCTCPA